MPAPRFRKSEAVIDSSCLQCLLTLEKSFPAYKLFRALSLRYYAIHIPRHVWSETARHGRRRAQLQRLLDDYPFFKRCHVGDDHKARLLYDKLTNPLARIDRGEAEAIIQAQERGISQVLIDERRGRQIAKAHTLTPKGIVGLIKDFRRNEVIPAARPLFEECKRTGFRLKNQLIDEALRDLCESP